MNFKIRCAAGINVTDAHHAAREDVSRNTATGTVLPKHKIAIF